MLLTGITGPPSSPGQYLLSSPAHPDFSKSLGLVPQQSSMFDNYEGNNLFATPMAMLAGRSNLFSSPWMAKQEPDEES